MTVSALIVGCSGVELTSDEKAFFREADPWGFILFKRNCEEPEQVRRLVDAMRDTVGRGEAPVLIDQEGGRVQRLKPPHWPTYPAGRRFGELFERDPERGRRSLYNVTRLLAEDLATLGITVDCMPVLDIPVPGAHDVIGDRAYARDPETVALLGRLVCEALLDGGVLPVIKHVPGHGRAGVDSHLSLPVVETSADELRATDFAPFKALADMPLAMTAHVVYTALDPERPATTSPQVIGEVIRREIGFDGLLMSDDLSMQALAGSFADRMGGCLAAGCDVGLHCNGAMAEMVEVAKVAPPLEGEAMRRAEGALARRKAPLPFDRDAALADLAVLMPESV
ncbi:beta-N-acetylhexosaminidase [Rhodoligotrophos defluvii]|uniref:beta-N-acetylhexosaminidase n=1 Tax=Rhodoligotrophos defluvii TaxID=2561934 RepID=UPI0010C956EA|nr:beta-N-acetylhexosaminidase [Rhodoligotrophos defluvii]